MEALITAIIYGGLVFYGSYDIFFFGFVIVLGTVTVFYSFDKFRTVTTARSTAMLRGCALSAWIQ